jgi:hypothetical protein
MRIPAPPGIGSWLVEILSATRVPGLESVWNQQLAAGRKIALVATHFDRCADWFGHSLRWRGPNTFVYGWLPSAGTEQ